MEHTYWHKQAAGKPLYPDLLWSRPENRQHAGKLLIIGGNEHSLLAPAEAYQAAQTAGIGSTRVLLPDALKKQVARFQGATLEIELAPSTPSGSFSQKALDVVVDQAAWADGILLAGDFGRNSETAILLEKIVSKTLLPLVATQDAADYLMQTPDALLARKRIILVITIAQLQKLARNLKLPQAVTFDINLVQLVDFLHKLTEDFPPYIAMRHSGHSFVAVNGQVSTTPYTGELEDSWCVKTATFAAVWWLQNPTKPFEALSSYVLH
jgi:hypothetical protein